MTMTMTLEDIEHLPVKIRYVEYSMDPVFRGIARSTLRLRS